MSYMKNTNAQYAIEMSKRIISKKHDFDKIE